MLNDKEKESMIMKVLVVLAFIVVLVSMLVEKYYYVALY